MAPLPATAPAGGRRITVTIDPAAWRWLWQTRVDRDVTAAAVIRALIAEAEADPALLDRAIIRTEADT